MSLCHNAEGGGGAGRRLTPDGHDCFCSGLSTLCTKKVPFSFVFTLSTFYDKSCKRAECDTNLAGFGAAGYLVTKHAVEMWHRDISQC